MEEKNILTYNEDVLPYVYSTCKYGVHIGGKENPVKDISFLITTDVHRCGASLLSAIKYMNEIPCIDFGVNLGDTAASYFSENDGKWYIDALKTAKKPFYPVAGNHDGGNDNKKEHCGTRAEVFDKFFEPVKSDIMGMPELDKTYYSVNFDKYKITLIVLDNYIHSEDRYENGDFVFSRGEEVYNQEQLDWLIDTLAKVPEGYHVMIAMHSYFEDNFVVPCVWTKEGAWTGGNRASLYDKNDVIARIVDAWLNSYAIDFDVKPVSDERPLPVINVKADFTKCHDHAFIGYFIGHTHWDLYARNKMFPNQNIFTFSATAFDLWQNESSDLIRVKGTKTEDCITVCGIDTKQRKIKFARVGSNVTINMTERKCFMTTY